MKTQFSGTADLSALTVSPPNPQRFVALDALRGVAALIVFGVHYHFEFWPHAGGIISTSSSYLAVDFFILLSGFVLAHAFFERPGFDFPAFLRKRVFRMWPLHLVTLAGIVVIMLLAGETVHLDGLLLNIMLLHNVGIGDIQTSSFNYPSWSLSVELVANLVVAAIILAVPNKFWNGVILAGLSVISGAILFISVNSLSSFEDNLFGILNTGLLRGFVAFPMGILAYRLFAANRHRLEKAAGKQAMLAAGLLAVFVMSFYYPGSGRSDFVYLLLYPALVICIAAPGEFWLRVLSPLRILGELSFSLYLVHVLVLKALQLMGWHPAHYLSGLAASLGTALLVAAAAHFYIERPAYRWLVGKSQQSAEDRNQPA